MLPCSSFAGTACLGKICCLPGCIGAVCCEQGVERICLKPGGLADQFEQGTGILPLLCICKASQSDKEGPGLIGRLGLIESCFSYKPVEPSGLRLLCGRRGGSCPVLCQCAEFAVCTEYGDIPGLRGDREFPRVCCSAACTGKPACRNNGSISLLPGPGEGIRCPGRMRALPCYGRRLRERVAAAVPLVRGAACALCFKQFLDSCRIPQVVMYPG